jgi:predicted AlkP superfamily pyrophosphatase or phosphodiesterase
MLIRIVTILLIIVSVYFLLQISPEKKPALVVYISIDQMRYDYLERFEPYFASSGFSLLLEKGANLRNCNYEHYCTYTGPGHACLGTSCYAGKSGIVGNSWFNRNENISVYCVDDLNYYNLEDVEDKNGAKSAEKLAISTLGDEMKNNNEKSKVFSVSGKDRAAILMLGKKADAAFWYNTNNGHFITSNYYLNQMPDWANTFNNKNYAQTYFDKKWEKLLAEDAYDQNCTVDDYPAEAEVNTMGRTFPHKLDAGNKDFSHEFYDNLKRSPFGDYLTLQFAMQLVSNENLGLDDVTDLLCLSLSSTDYVGHAWGPDSHEMMDMQLRLDRYLQEFFLFIDKKIGLDNVYIILTADHGVAQFPELLKEKGVDAGRINPSEIGKATEDRLQEIYGSPGKDKQWIASWGNASIYLGNEFWEKTKTNPREAYNVLKEGLLNVDGIAAAYSRLDIENNVEGEYLDFVKKAFESERSGDVIFIQKPNWLFNYRDGNSTGTSHGSPFEYDTHVPMLFYGEKIIPGNYDDGVGTADIAISIGKMIGVEMPGERDGESFISFFKEQKNN